MGRAGAWLNTGDGAGEDSHSASGPGLGADFSGLPSSSDHGLGAMKAGAGEAGLSWGGKVVHAFLSLKSRFSTR